LLLVDDGLRSNAFIAHIVPMPILLVLESLDGLCLHHLDHRPLVQNSLTEAVLSQVYPYVGNEQFLRVPSCLCSPDCN